MATTAWGLQGATETTIDATDVLQFAGPSFGSPIIVGEYNDSTHVATSGGADKSAPNTPVNNKYISTNQVDVGSGTVALNSITNAQAALHLEFSDNASVQVIDHIFYAYDGTTVNNGPTGVNFFAAEVGNANWTAAEGQGSALALADQTTPATTHDYYIATSVTPESTGLKDSFVLRHELTYI